MATTAAVARNLLRNSKSLPQMIRGQILFRSNLNVNINNMAKEHQLVQSSFVSNQKLHAQILIFDFSEMGSFLGSSSGGQSLVQKLGDGRGMGGTVVETRGKRLVKDEDEDDGEFDDEDDGEFDDGDDFEDVEDFVDDDDDYDDECKPVDYDEDKKNRRRM